MYNVHETKKCQKHQHIFNTKHVTAKFMFKLANFC